MPAISVVIPVYNAGPFLREALDSLLAQTCGDFEAIAVNDGSTDNSLEILKEYAARDSRIRILDGPNGGYGKAMNRGMDAATGKYMAILEPDDYLPREAYAVLLPLAEQHQLDVVKGTYCSFYEENGQRHFRYSIPLRRPGGVWCTRRDFPGAFEHIWTGLQRLSFLREHGIRFHESPGAAYQDTGFFFLVAANAERYMLSEEVTYFYRVDNPQSSINNLGCKKMAVLGEYEYIRRELKAKPEQWQRLKLPFLSHWAMSMLWTAKRIPESELPEFCELLRERLSEKDKELLPSHFREPLERLLQGSASAEEKVCNSPMACRKFLCGLVRLEMSRELTRVSVLRIPILERRLLHVWRHFQSGVSAKSGLLNAFYCLGVRVKLRPVDVYAQWPANSIVEANVEPR